MATLNSLQLAEISKCVARTWDLLSPQDKLPYEEMAAANTLRRIDGSTASYHNSNETKKRLSIDITRQMEATARSSKAEDDIDIIRNVPANKRRSSQKGRILRSPTMRKSQILEYDECHGRIAVPLSLVPSNRELFGTNIVSPQPRPRSEDKGFSAADNTENIEERTRKNSVENLEPTIAVGSNKITPKLLSPVIGGTQQIVGFKVFAQRLHPIVLHEYNYLSSEDVVEVLESVWCIMPEGEREPYAKLEKEEKAFKNSAMPSFHERT